ncbi:MAG: hypothetical protein C4298_04400 [Thermus sp.]|uniref:DUF4282 domain-containing protein n=1 Tax=Thermus sp. TaxID=275 RepID=UPI003326DE93
MNPREFFQALFDLAFRRFITIRLTGVLYALALAVMAVILLAWGLGGFREGFLQGLVQLFLLAPLAFLLYAIGLRILLEGVVALVRVAENTSLMVEEMRKKS